jgi:hypothetical protein
VQSLEGRVRATAADLRRIAAELDDLSESRQEPGHEDGLESPQERPSEEVLEGGPELTGEERLADALGSERRRGLFSRK